MCCTLVLSVCETQMNKRYCPWGSQSSEDDRHKNLITRQYKMFLKRGRNMTIVGMSCLSCLGGCQESLHIERYDIWDEFQGIQNQVWNLWLKAWKSLTSVFYKSSVFFCSPNSSIKSHIPNTFLKVWLSPKWVISPLQIFRLPWLQIFFSAYCILVVSPKHS